MIYPQINKETRTARLRIELSNPDFALLPECMSMPKSTSAVRRPCWPFPRAPCWTPAARQAVFVDKGEGRFEPREVKLGHRGGGYVEVREGVTEGEPVVVSANFLIDAESNLKAALKGFSDAGAKP